ncbi:hypothetical protein [Streptomyces sp. NPDC088400]
MYVEERVGCVRGGAGRLCTVDRCRETAYAGRLFGCHPRLEADR